jgi:aryl-alcohol dehydrogenase-like predicted oxidoreductase
VTFLDTANVYSDGTSEEIVGRAVRDFARREDVVLATKVHGRMRPGPNGGGLSRKAIMTEIDASLRRLGTDYVDLYQIHRWDPHTPVEETMEALHDVVKAGKARYLGASSMWAWQFAKAQSTAERRGWTPFVSMQDHYNLLYREEEREVLPLCADQGVGVIPWSPLARGRLARAWDEDTERSATDAFGTTLYVASDRTIVERVAEVAAGSASRGRRSPWRGCSRSRRHRPDRRRDEGVARRGRRRRRRRPARRRRPPPARGAVRPARRRRLLTGARAAAAALREAGAAGR